MNILMNISPNKTDDYNNGTWTKDGGDGTCTVVDGKFSNNHALEFYRYRLKYNLNLNSVINTSTQDYSLCFWFKALNNIPSNSGYGWFIFIPYDWGIGPQGDGSQIRGRFGSPSSNELIASVSLDNDWHFFCLSYHAGQSGNIYLDGSLVKSNINNGAFLNNINIGPVNDDGQAKIVLDDWCYVDVALDDIIPTHYLTNRVLSLYKDTQNKVYGNSSGIFSVVDNDYTQLSSSDKIQLFNDYNINSLSYSDIAVINDDFTILTYTDEFIATNVYMTAIPTPQTVIPFSLIIISSYEHLDSMTLTYTQSGSGIIKVAITKNLEDYYVYNNSVWTQINLNDISTDGISPDNFNLIPESAWHTFTEGEGGIALAYYISQQDSTDVASLDELEIQGDGKGTWDSAIENTDFTYKYAGNETLRVRLITAGDYKINYSE